MVKVFLHYVQNRLQKLWRIGLSMLFLLSSSIPAHAQLEKVEEGLDYLQAFIIGISVTVMTIIIVWQGFEVATGRKKLSDCYPMLLGGCLIGGAGSLAGFVVG